MTKIYAYFYCIFLAAAFAISPLKATDADDWLKNGPPKFIGVNNWGNDFWLTVPPPLNDQGAGAENVIKLYITAVSDAKVKIEVPAKGYSEVITASKNATVDFEISPVIAQPYLKSGFYPSIPDELFEKTGIHIESDAFISVYVVVRYRNLSEGYCALPVSALGNEYMVSTYEDATSQYPSYNSMPSICGIVAAFDNTKVTFKLANNLGTMTSGGMKPGDSAVKYLRKGDVWMISSKGNGADLTGSRINADKPVAVLSGNQNANIPLENTWGGYLVEMEQPVRAWGTSYHIPRIIGRKYGPVLRVFATEPDTRIMLNGYLLGILNPSDGSNTKAFIETRSLIDNGSNSVITATKPISVTMYNTGTTEDGSPEPPGDPFQMLLSPSVQYQGQIQYSIPGNQLGMKFESNYLNLIYELAPGGGVPDDLKLGIVTGDIVNWQNLKQISSVVYDKFRTQVDGKDYGMAIVKMPAYGQFRIMASSPVMGYLYGFSESGSYGFPASICTKDANGLDKLPPVPTWTSDCDGTINGKITDMPDDNIKRSNLAIPQYGSIASFNYNVEVAQIIPGITRSANWSLTVREKDQDARGVFTFRDMAGNDTTVVILYKAVKMTADPVYHNYGFVKRNVAVFKDIVLYNNTDSTITINKVSLKDGNVGFSVNPIAKTILPPNASMTATVKFQSGSKGLFTDSLGFGDDCLFFFKTKLEATTGNSEINVSDVKFSDLPIGSIDSSTAVINNAGLGDLNVTGYDDFIDQAAFKAVFDKAISPATPLVIRPGENYTFKVFFTPQTEKDYTDRIIFKSDADRYDSIAVVNARGVKPGLLSKSFDWGRKRIYRANYPIASYPGGADIIKLENIGTQTLDIKTMIIDDEKNGSAFIFDADQFKNVSLPESTSVLVHVDFLPTVLGENRIVMAYQDNSGNIHTTRTKLAGFGTAPKITDDPVSFDTTLIKMANDVRSKNIKIVNKDINDWEFADTLKITGFVSEPAGAISFADDYGTAGFKLDISNLKFPIMVPPGGSVDIPADFSAVIEGQNQAKLVVKSDAYTADNSDVKIALEGTGITRVVSMEGGEVSTCIFMPDTISCILKNKGKKQVNIKSLAFESIEEEFSFADPLLTQGFAIDPMTSKIIYIVFKPRTKVDKTIVLVAETDEAQGDLVKAELRGKTILVSRNLLLNPVSQTAYVGDKLVFKAALVSGEDIKPYGIKEINVKLDYTGGFLAPDLEAIDLGADMLGRFEIIKSSIVNKNNSLSFTIRSIASQIFDITGELVIVPMNIFLPPDDENKSTVTISMTPANTNCVSIEKSESRITIKPVCGGSLRRVTLSGTSYGLAPVSPNPVGAQGADIEYSIGIEGFTIVKIISAAGAVMAVPVSGVVKSGSYSFPLPIGDMSSGIYFVQISSGPYTDIQRLIIAK